VTPTGGTPTPTPTPIVFAGGDFTKLGSENDANATTHNRIGAVWGEGARKFDDTAVQGQSLAWKPDASTTIGARVQAIAVGDPVGNAAGTQIFAPVYFGGQFTADFTYTNLAASRFSLTKATSVAAHTYFGGWKPEPNGSVRSLALDNGRIYVGGDFTQIGDSVLAGARGQRDRLASLTAVPAGQGELDTACASNALCPAVAQSWNPAPDAAVKALAVPDGGVAVYAGGNFAQIGDGALPAGRADRGGLAAIAGPGEANAGVVLDWDARPAGGGTNALALAGDALFAGGGFFSVDAEKRAGQAQCGR
jgi:hypothetical protein